MELSSTLFICTKRILTTKELAYACESALLDGSGVCFFHEAILQHRKSRKPRVSATAAAGARTEAADASPTICLRRDKTMEMPMLDKRMHKGRVKDIFVRPAKRRERVAIRICSRFVLAITLGLLVSSSQSWVIKISLRGSLDYGCLGSRVSATAAAGARTEAADASPTICLRRSRLA